MSEERPGRIASLVVALLLTAGVSAVAMLMGYVSNGDPSRVPVGCVVGLSLAFAYSYFRDRR